MERWFESRYGGLFTELGPVPTRPHDPAVAIHAGSVGAGLGGAAMPASGAGWDAAAAEGACVGEAIERFQCRALGQDRSILARAAGWPLDEPPVEPGRWVLFHPQQYAQPGFPFQPFTDESLCRWVCFREAGSGAPWWVPEDMAFLDGPAGHAHALAPSISTGLSSGRAAGGEVLLRGLEEVLERDALTGAWMQSYPLEEWDFAWVLRLAGEAAARRILRPNLRYRAYRVGSPYSRTVTLVTLAGEDRDGWCFSVGSACRETLAASFGKAILEAVQGRHYVRHQLLSRGAGREAAPRPPQDFAEHAVFYTRWPHLLAGTPLERAERLAAEPEPPPPETLAVLRQRLGRERPVLFRNVTPPGVAQQAPEWLVLRVVVPGLQPLHGHHALAQLGGALWAPRGLAEWLPMPPHPFP
jgi:ribosomal protein S12 methylthiotransferase accessory factor